MFDLEHVEVEVRDPLPALDCEFQITERVADKGLDFAPEEARVFVSYIGRARVTQTRVAPDLLKFVKERIELPRVKRVSELADEVGCPPVNFGAIYGMGAQGLQQYAWDNYDVVLTRSEAQRQLDTFERQFRQLSKWRRRHAELCRGRRSIRIGAEAAKGIALS